MCLDTVDKEIKVTEGEGWKTFYCDPENHLVYGTRGGRVPGIGRWITDKAHGTIPLSISRNSYPKGFHVYKNYPELGSARFTRKVSYRNVVAVGRQSVDVVIVAREIYIHPKGGKK